METIQFADTIQYTFVQQFLVRDGTALWNAQLDHHSRRVATAHPTLAKLLQRVAGGGVAVLPFLAHSRHSWIVAGADRRTLEQTLATASRFIVPTYAEFTGEGGAPVLQLFTPELSVLHQTGVQLYPAGYYSLQSPPGHLPILLQRLDLWLDIEARRPIFGVERPRTYQELYTSFDTALAAGSWDEAEHMLQELRHRHLITADNYAFLQVQLLHQQTRWHAIWERSDFSTLANLRMPRRVRAALLSAFHQVELLSHETAGHLDAALDAFKRHRPRLGLLLTGRYELADPQVVRVFAYLATLEQDQATLHQLRAVTEDDASLKLIDALAARFAPTLVPSPMISPQRRARLALADYNFDAAIAAAEELAPGDDQTLILIDIALSSMDSGYAEIALVAFRSLPDDRQVALSTQDLRIRGKLSVVQQLAASVTHSPSARIDIGDWSVWFAQLAADSHDDRLGPALERLVTSDDPTQAHMFVQQLSSAVSLVVIDEALLSNAYTRRALAHLTNLFLQDSQFPRESEPYQELYEALYTGLLDRREVNVTNSLALIRLAEALLRTTPTRHNEIHRHFEHWYNMPVPALEVCVLESFELLSEYGIVGSQLIPWYRLWASFMLSLPSKRDRTTLETWRSFGAWIQPGADILQQIQDMLQPQGSVEEPSVLASLPMDFRIGIFTLRRSSADRARDLLLAHNRDLNIRICTETDLNDQSKAIAQNSDISVIVTTCITHALTYGIRPFLAREPIYPASSGSTSIVRAIELWARDVRPD